MKKVIHLTEQDIRRIVTEALKEQNLNEGFLKLLHSTAVAPSNVQPANNGNSNSNNNGENTTNAPNTGNGLSQQERVSVSEAMANCNMEEAAQQFKTALLQAANQCDNANFNRYVKGVMQSWNNLVDNCVAD